MYRRTRIVATLGPSTDRPGVLEALLRHGLDVARINFSHGSAAEHIGRINHLRAVSANWPRPVAVLADLPGPKLRAILNAPLPLALHQEIRLARTPEADADLRVTEPELARDLQPGHRLLLDDGRLQCRTVRCEPDYVLLRVEVGGTLLPGKGVNLPDTPLSLPALTDRDHEALSVAAEAGVDWLALSFVRAPEAAQELRAAARRHRLAVPILAKIERPEGVARAVDIIAAFDGIMVARGDLGVEIPLEQVPLVQKQLIAQARASGKPVITATDMLDSMRGNPRPTRAEASDVANAVLDGSDAVMLSGETAVGDYPIEALACMDRIARAAEQQFAKTPQPELIVPRGQLDDHITLMTVTLAQDIQADAIVIPSYTGQTACLVARHRPRMPLVAPAPNPEIQRRLALVWGLRPVPMLSTPQTGEDRLESAVRSAFAFGAVSAGQRVVVLAAHAVEGGQRFPTIRVVRVGPDGRSTVP